MNNPLAGFKIPSICRGIVPWCVAVKQEGDSIMVADTKNPQQDPLVFTADEWQSFIKSVTQGEFNF